MFVYVFGCGGRIRTCDLQLMRLAGTTRLPYSAIYSWWTEGESNSYSRLAKPLCYHYHYQPIYEHTLFLAFGKHACSFG